MPGIVSAQLVSVCRLALPGVHLAKLMPPGTNERLPNVITLTIAVFVYHRFKGRVAQLR